jgi:nucleoside-diphosphate-sugar epimerase
MERGERGVVYNVGGGEEVTMLEAIDALQAISGSTLVLTEGSWREGDARRTSADTSRLRASTGWVPSTPFAEGLAAQWRWAAGRLATR